MLASHTLHKPPHTHTCRKCESDHLQISLFCCQCYFRITTSPFLVLSWWRNFYFFISVACIFGFKVINPFHEKWLDLSTDHGGKKNISSSVWLSACELCDSLTPPSVVEVRNLLVFNLFQNMIFCVYTKLKQVCDKWRFRKWWQNYVNYPFDTSRVSSVTLGMMSLDFDVFVCLKHLQCDWFQK